MKGIHLLKKVRGEYKLAALPVLLVTDEAKKEQTVKADPAGDNDYVAKPFTAITLKEKHHNNIKTNDNYQTSTDCIFAAGDANTGASLVVSALTHGIQAAQAINNFLLKR